jgi:hypothetical protein
MGNISTGEKIAVGFLALIYYPFRLVYMAIRTVGEEMGLIEKEQTEYTISPEQQAENERIAAEEMEKLGK